MRRKPALAVRPGLTTKPRRRIVNRPEQEFQIATATLLRVYEARDLLVFCHVPNGAKRGKVEAARMKDMGLRAGVSDLLVWHRFRPPGHFQMELKAPDEKPRKNQIEWHNHMDRMGVRVYVVLSIGDVLHALEAEGIPAITRGLI